MIHSPSSSHSIPCLCLCLCVKMLLGNPRPQIKRTASVSRITVDVRQEKGQQPYDDQNPDTKEISRLEQDVVNYTFAFASPRGRRSLSHNSSLHFLRTCSFCQRRLSPARDIYMYMGDTAFCSMECREQSMEQEKCTTAGGGGGRAKER
ncbi:uncharacterized protein LOC111447249 [Cucurbita moschata]|uniref:Uncharacterized protein LOC111447249 n=1 Tax=Cucurbita moschata TaxID=3662 RepID=A0A6J1FVI2_CUCMO|nr:uncharacterized protein LOC111447249 [Cucurbita moschata]